MLAPGQFERIAKALADPRRFAMLETIGEARECANQALCNDFPVSKATISHHVKELAQAGLIEPVREGQYVTTRFGRTSSRPTRLSWFAGLGRLQTAPADVEGRKAIRRSSCVQMFDGCMTVCTTDTSSEVAP